MRVVAAMLFCGPVFAQDVKLPSVTNSIGMELIELPAGKFTMGSPADSKVFCRVSKVSLCSERCVKIAGS